MSGQQPGPSWWRRSSGNRTIAGMAAVAVLALTVGLLLGRLVVSPAQAAADAAAPAAGFITVPIELRRISNDIVLRGDVRYDDPQALTVAAAGGEASGGPAVVTGAVPAVGALLRAGSVALEVTGRPLIVLPGQLPVYRTLRVGAVGPDVRQLQDALRALRIRTGSNGTYDAATAAGVVELYRRAGYQPPAPAEADRLAAEEADRSVRAARVGVDTARAALAAATAGPTRAGRLAADNAVREQQRMRHAALAAGNTDAAAAAADALALAVAERQALSFAPPAPQERIALQAAEKELQAAVLARRVAAEGVVTALPAGEVAYLSSVPRRVSAVDVRRGSTVDGPVMQVSGATLQIVAAADAEQAALLRPGTEATFTVPGGAPLRATVQAVRAAALAPEGADVPAAARPDEPGEPAAPAPSSPARSEVVLLPQPLTAAQAAALQGSNVRLSVPVAATDGEVLAVPLAALTAGPGGEARIERATGGGATELVTVTTGLSAGGFAEITGRGVRAGDLVVVGQ